MHETAIATEELSKRLTIEVWLNGEYLCRAGIAEYGTLSAQIWQSRMMSLPHPGAPKDERRLFEHIVLQVLGRREKKSVHWGETIHLKAGDEVVMKVVESDNFDPPQERDPSLARRLMR